jgi:hypothetical protein
MAPAAQPENNLANNAGATGRWRALMAGVEQDDVMAWRDSFVASLSEAKTRAPKPRPARIAAARRDG